MTPSASEPESTTCPSCNESMYGLPAVGPNGECSWCVREAAYKTKIDALISKKGAYKVQLASAGNIDFGQNPNRSMPGVPRRVLRVASLADASKACLAYIEHYELGGGNWMGGEVKKDGVVFAQISYNGRAWMPGKWSIGVPMPKEISLTTEAVIKEVAS